MLITQRYGKYPGDERRSSRRENKGKGVKSSRSSSLCFGKEDIKDEGRCCGGGNVDTRQQQGREAEIAEK